MIRSKHWKAITLMAAAPLLLATTSNAQCPASAPPGANNVLYLYYPTATDATFPEFGAMFGFPTSPAEPFDVADLDPTIGTTAALRSQVTGLVREDYCEFDVRVQETTSAVTPADPRWQIIAIGSDADAPFGIAEDVDINDLDPQDHARVWSQTFLNICGGAGGALNGANSTLARWANAIAGTTSHEAGHNYGLLHGDSAPRPGSNEDGADNHILGTGSTGLTCEDRVTNRHFSDTSYEILAHNIGLRAKTVHNWDFSNPNLEDAAKLKIKILSTAATLTLSWSYSGSLSPWGTPTVTGPTGTETFQGTVYNVFTLEFSTPDPWSGGSPGLVSTGVKFHTGAAFAEPDPIIVRGTELCDINGDPLLLHPRVFGYDTADIDLGSGAVNVNIFNMQPARGPLEIRDVVVQRLPRQAHIDSMLRGVEPFGVSDRLPIEPWSRQSFEQIELGERGATLKIGAMSEKRNVQIRYSDDGCEPGVIRDMPEGYAEIDYCADGWALGPMPATSVYLTATVIDPNARQWDKQLEQYVTRPLETRVYYQLAGVVPDLNDNGVDDLIDIAEGTSSDRNRNGVPDEAEKKVDSKR